MKARNLIRGRHMFQVIRRRLRPGVYIQAARFLDLPWVVSLGNLDYLGRITGRSLCEVSPALVGME